MGLSDDPALQLLAAQRFAADKVPRPPAVALHAQMPPRTGRIRLGHLSGNLHMHTLGLLVPELFELHDRSRFEVDAFCWTPESALPQSQRILAAVDHHVRLAGVDDLAAARLVAQAGIDVLVDLQGLTNGARPKLHKPPGPPRAMACKTLALFARQQRSQALSRQDRRHRPVWPGRPDAAAAESVSPGKAA